MTPHDFGRGMQIGGSIVFVVAAILDATVLRRDPDALRYDWSFAPRILRAYLPRALKPALQWASLLVVLDIIEGAFFHGRRTPLQSIVQIGGTWAGMAVGMAIWSSAIAPCVAHSLYSRSIGSCPGWVLQRWARWLFSKRTFTEILEPVLSDMQVEYFEALAQNRPRKACWVRLRGCFSFWSHVALQIPVDLARVVVALWKLGR